MRDPHSPRQLRWKRARATLPLRASPWRWAQGERLAWLLVGLLSCHPRASERTETPGQAGASASVTPLAPRELLRELDRCELRQPGVFFDLGTTAAERLTAEAPELATALESGAAWPAGAEGRLRALVGRPT